MLRSGRRCCVMQAYFKPDTRENRIAWLIFAVSLLIALVLTPLGSAELNSCAKTYNKCLKSHNITTDYTGVCQSVLYQCNAIEWYRVFVWGIIFFVVSFGCLCYFWCCAAPPGYHDRQSYMVSGTMMGPGSAGPNALFPMEAQPLFHPGMQYSGGMMYATNNGMQQLPPAYQYAYQYPTHVPGNGMPPSGAGYPYPVVQLQQFVPMHTVTIGGGPEPPPYGYTSQPQHGSTDVNATHHQMPTGGMTEGTPSMGIPVTSVVGATTEVSVAPQGGALHTMAEAEVAAGNTAAGVSGEGAAAPDPASGDVAGGQRAAPEVPTASLIGDVK